VLDFADFELLAVELLLVAAIVAIAAAISGCPTLSLVVAGFILASPVSTKSLSRELILPCSCPAFFEAGST
jgi:hypothetical protein